MSREFSKPHRVCIPPIKLCLRKYNCELTFITLSKWNLLFAKKREIPITDYLLKMEQLFSTRFCSLQSLSRCLTIILKLFWHVTYSSYHIASHIQQLQVLICTINKILQPPGEDIRIVHNTTEDITRDE